MRYALIDWDNTLRKGYCLFTWCSYLVDRRVVSGNLQVEIDTCIERHRKSLISYNELSIYSGEIFAKHLRGLNETTINNYIDEYKTFDYGFFHIFTQDVFSILLKYNVKPIIVSGSPKNIITRFKNEFSIYDIYAFEAEVINGIYTGKVQNNYGFNKGRVIDQLCKKYNCEPLLAMGDSEADLPLFDVAKYSICIGTDNKTILGNSKAYTLSADDTNGVLRYVEEAVKFQ